MLPTSNTYDYQSIEVELLIREAFENIGVFGEFVESQKLESARRSIQFLLQEWESKSTNLWTLQTRYISLNPNQGKYNLADQVNNISDLIQVNLRNYTRQLDGVPQSNSGQSYDDSGGGTAASAFDSNEATACIQTLPDGNISFDYGENVTQKINFIGIQSNTTQNYSLVVEYSQTPENPDTWFPLRITAPMGTFIGIPKQEYPEGIGLIKWFDIQIPVDARAYRIRETGGLTLNIREIYFNNRTSDLPMSKISRDEYYSFPNKLLQGRPNLYYLERLISPNLFIWPVPSSLAFNCLQCSYKRAIMDVGAFMNNTVDVPARFYPALTLGLSWKLAIKFKPEAAESFRTLYEEAFTIATIEDSENTPITIMPDYNAGYR